MNRLQTFITTWDNVVKVVPTAPADLAQYASALHKILKYLANGDSLRVRGDYLSAWTTRSYLMDLVYADGYIELPLGSITLNEYTNINPDMKRNVKRLLA